MNFMAISLRPKLNKLFSRNNFKLQLILIILIALAIRIYFIFIREFWYDEAYTGLIINMPWREMVNALHFDVHPPLYYIIIKFWSEIFGNTDAALRFFSTFANLIFIAITVFFLKKYLAEKKFALAIGYLLAFNPFLILFAPEARMYSLLLLLYTLTMIVYAKAIDSDKKITWLAFAILLALCFYTHYIAIIAAPSFLIAWLLGQKKLQNFLYTIICLLAAFLLYYPWLSIFLFQLFNNQKGIYWVAASELVNIGETVSVFIFGAIPSHYGNTAPLDYRFFKLNGNFFEIMTALFLPACGYYLAKIKKYKSAAIFFIFGPLSLIFVYIFSKITDMRIYEERYLIIFLPACFILFFFILFLNNKKLFYFVLAAYILMLAAVDLPDYPKQFGKLNGKLDLIAPEIKQIIVTDADLFVKTKYYISDKLKTLIKIYNFNDPKYNYNGWVVINNDDKILADDNLGSGSVIISQDYNYLLNNFSNFKPTQIDNLYYIFID